MTSPVRLPLRATVLAIACVVGITACGAGDPVAVPGVAVAPVSSAPLDEADTFTPVARVAAPAAPTTTAPPTSTPTTTAPPTTAPPVTTITLPATTRVVPAGPIPIPVLATISGWPAFDLHLQTILDAGSDAVSATVFHEGAIVHEVALGRRTASGGRAEVGDRYRIASISKVITSITLLRLVQAGQLDLDVPVGAQLAARVGVTPTAEVSEITPRQLLTHRSGIAQYENLMFRRQVESCDQAAATGLSRPLERAPGTTFRYSNLNFCLLGLLIEEVTARPYADVVRDELLAPLGIEGMRLAGTFDVRDGDVEHRSDEGRNYMEVLGASGSWIASPTDVATIVDALDLTTAGWKPLTSEFVDVMRTITIDPPILPDPEADPEVDPTATTVPPPPTRGYGMGLMIFGPDSFGHTGTLESTHAMTARRADGYTWAITVSGDHPSSSRDLAGIIDDALRYAGLPT